ncbi:MAG: flagellar basal body rod C-terminal domain-containing protein, partial [Clostridiaceae bacterium]|nr:flagellar basal body rod C-terminal domain-containing protein [Clostridiaceae bacterium]
GITLIDHIDYNKLATEDKSVPGISDIGGGKISDIVWEGMGNQKVRIESGELKGLLDMRDGDGKGFNYRGLPYYLNNLNEFAKGFASSFNNQHAQGVDYDGNQGGSFFYDPDPLEINSVNFSVNPDILLNPNKVAASSLSQGESDNGNVNLLIELRKSTTMFTSLKGTPDDFIKSILSALAVDSSQSKRMTENSLALLHHTENRRLSESGVSLDEEMTNMVKFQQAYNASARMITTLDAILDTTVNRLGLVGR